MKGIGSFKKVFGIILSVSLLIFLSNIGDTFAARSTIIIKGSTTVLPIAQIAAEVFMNRNPDVDISVQGGGSGVGIASIIDGTCDIADSSRPIKGKELKKAKIKGINLKANVIAMDGIAVIVHPSNKVNGISKNKIKDIYTGKISNWAELGGANKKIVVVSRDTASGTFEAFNKLVLDEEKVRPDALMQTSNQAVATVVARTPGAIGYVGLGYLSAKVKAIAIDGVAPSKEAVRSGKYPLARSLFMYTNGEPEGLVKDFIDFILSEEGQKLVEEAGYIGLGK
ncbi:MAG: phosphate ABC transporter substrate-binding protein [Deltaproteobacteria bacterium]|nr:MAG: phosphate ABC transporter substrate-binding protein [Deltaproteobacteria bacterium]